MEPFDINRVQVLKQGVVPRPLEPILSSDALEVASRLEHARGRARQRLLRLGVKGEIPFTPCPIPSRPVHSRPMRITPRPAPSRHRPPRPVPHID